MGGFNHEGRYAPGREHDVRKKVATSLVAVGTATLGLSLLLTLMVSAGPGVSSTRGADRALVVTPTVTAVDPDSAPNDIETAIVLSGSGFTATMSGTSIITAPTVTLGDTELDDVVWGSTTTLSTTVPWGLDPGVYTLTVVNPDGGTGSLPNGFTVTQGIGVWTTGGPYGGRVNFVTLHPDDPTMVYAGTQWAGLFVSGNAGKSWRAILPGDFSNRLAFDAISSDVMYFSGDSAQFYRTEDGGQTWEPIPALFRPENGCYTVRAAAHPTATGVIYAGTGGCGDIPVLPGEGGIFYSEDYGVNWVTRTQGLTDTDVVDIAFHPTDPLTMALATRSGNVFSTTNGGKNWALASKIDHDLRRIYISPNATNAVWAVPEIPYNPAVPAYLYRSSDLTAWEVITLTGDPLPFGGIWGLTFAPGEIWAAGDWGYFSEDGGETWSPVVDESHELMGIRSFAIDPTDPSVMYAAGSARGVLRSLDGGATWAETNEGLAALTTRDVAATPGQPDLVYVETFEYGLLRSDNGGYAWQGLDVTKFGAPKGELVAVDPYSTTRVYYPQSCSDDNPCSWYSADRGSSWHEVQIGLPVTYTGWTGELTAIATHPLVSGTLFAGVGFYEDRSDFDGGTEPCGVYRSLDHGESWAFMGPTPAISEVHDFAFDAVDPDLIYAATAGDGLWRTEDGGMSWANVPISDTQSPVYVPAMATHPDVPGKIYVRTYSYAESPNPEPELWVSEDAGETWELLGYVFLGVDLIISPPVPDQVAYSLYTGCEPGLCRSDDDGKSWEPVEGAPRPEFLAAASDGERSVIYLGSFGGLVSSVEAQGIGILEAVPEDARVLGGGVYRLTTRLFGHSVYLPLVLRDDGS